MNRRYKKGRERGERMESGKKARFHEENIQKEEVSHLVRSTCTRGGGQDELPRVPSAGRCYQEAR